MTKADEMWDELGAKLAPDLLRFARSSLLASVATWMAGMQKHTEYSLLTVWIAVFVISIVNRYHWVAGLVLAWLLMLYFVPPEMVAGLKAVRG